MDNPYDQFDSGPAVATAPTKNPYDQFDQSDAPVEKPATPSAVETLGEHAAAGVGPGAAFAAAAPSGAKSL